MANVTVNESLNATSSAVDTGMIVGEWIPIVLSRIGDLLATPFREPEMLWIIFPLLLTFIVLEFYFDHHRDDELGWAAAVANSLILFIVAIDLLRHSFPGATPWQVFMDVGRAVFTEATLPLEPQVLIMIIFLGILGVIVTIINYYHLLPRKLAFQVSGHPPVNFLAYFAIVIVYSTHTPHPVPLDITTLVAGAILYVLLLVGFFSLKKSLQRIFGGKRYR